MATEMACAQQMHMFDDGDAMFFGDGDLFGNTVPCLAGELELQVRSYEGTGDVPVGDSSAGKSFSITKDSGGSSLSALAADFGDPDFMDNVSLDDLAAADHYGHNICGRQSTADSTAAACSGRTLGTSNAWTGVGLVGADQKQPQRLGLGVAMRVGPSEAALQTGQQESSDCDMSHTHGDGESSGVGPGKSVALGSSHSEASEDNTAGVTPGAAARDEEHISMPSYGLSLSRLTHSGGGHNNHMPAEGAVKQQKDFKREQQSGNGEQQQQQASHNNVTAEQQRTHMPRAYSVDSFALANGAAAGAAAAAAACPNTTMNNAVAGPQLDGIRRAHVYRSYSYVAPDTLPMDFVLGCGDSCGVGSGGGQFSFGARGRCASLNETQLRRHWLQEGELLAPQLPPSVSELELLELPEDSIPVRPSSTGPFLGQPLHQQSQSRPVGSGGLMQFKGTSVAGTGSAAPAAPVPAPPPGVTVTVKRKIITSPSPLLQQPKAAKSRQAAAAAAAGPGGSATAKGQSPKRAKLSGAGAWQDASAASSAGLLAGWHPPRQAGAGAAAGGSGIGSMKTVRSMPANMNSYLDGVEVTVEPLGQPDPSSAFIGPNGGVNASAPTAHQSFARGGAGGSFFDPSAAGNATGRSGAVVATVPVGAPQAAAGATSKGTKSKTAAIQQPAGTVPSVVGVPGAFVAPGGVLMGPDGKRLGPVPSVPKPRKRASPNGNPPKAPAPNPNGHCCTQCGTQTTPVWRAGPHGPKTLCNACGVRYMKVAKGNVAPTPRRQQH